MEERAREGFGGGWGGMVRLIGVSTDRDKTYLVDGAGERPPALRQAPEEGHDLDMRKGRVVVSMYMHIH